MKIGSDCSGSCVDCSTYYIGGCLAGHGDDDFTPMSVDIVIRIVENSRGFYSQRQIDKAKDWLAKQR